MQFDFGKNWAEYSAHALDARRVVESREAFAALLEPAGGVRGKRFLDIGFGQGLGLLAARAMGADVVGVDINPTCGEVLRANAVWFPEVRAVDFPVIIGSILDPAILERVRAASPGGEGYDVVHSWGVLHHTGDMRLAVRNAASLVLPGGHLVVALYNRHWSSPAWRAIKRAYCGSPRPVQRLMVRCLTPIIFAAKWLVTGKDPRRQARGMDFLYDVVDWVGGYPYEYASRDEVLAMIEPLGFRSVGFAACEVPTGCNQFVFARARGASPGKP